MALWFGTRLRTSMGVEIEKLLSETGRGHRKCFYDEMGNDVRLYTPGVRWADMRERRRKVFDIFKEQCQEVLEKFCQQIIPQELHVEKQVGDTNKKEETFACTLAPEKPEDTPRVQVVCMHAERNTPHCTPSASEKDSKVEPVEVEVMVDNVEEERLHNEIRSDTVLPPLPSTPVLHVVVQKAHSKENYQQKSVEKMLRKQKEKKERIKQLEERRLQEIEQKKKRNAERAQKVAEKRKLEQEKKLLLRKRVLDSQQRLVEKIFKKQQEENQRMKELEKKRMQEIEQRKKRNAERAQKVAEKRKMEQEKRMLPKKVQGEIICAVTPLALPSTPAKVVLKAHSKENIIDEDYDINDLGSGDSTDEEDCPKKQVPVWAHPMPLKHVVLKQEEMVVNKDLDPRNIFPPTELLKGVDLARIFKQKRKRFYQRSSSAHWTSPLLKKGKFHSELYFSPST